MEYYNMSREFLSGFCLDESTIMEIGCFSILWGRVEYCFFENFFKESKIAPFVAAVSPRFDCSEWYEKIKSELLSMFGTTEICNRLRGNNDELKLLRAVYTSNSPTNSEMLQTAFFICSRVRNNMFHGEKDEYRLNSQKQLFSEINDFLSQLLQYTDCYKIKQ